MKKKIEEQLIQLWGKVGFIVNLSQMIEYNLANILAFDELLREFEKRDSMFVFEFNEFANKANEWYKTLESRTLGFGIKRAKELGYFDIESQKRLSDMCKERNYVIHSLFKDDLAKKHLETDPTFYFERLEKLIVEMNSINEDLSKIFAKQKEDYKLIW